MASGSGKAPPIVVTELGPDDVLFGRGAPIVQTTGNVRFRDLVHAHKGSYGTTRCRQTKDAIARDIIRIIVDQRGGRFLKEIKSVSSDAVRRKYEIPAEVTKAWIVADYDEIVEKVKQTLRESEKSSAAIMMGENADVQRNDRGTLVRDDNSMRSAQNRSRPMPPAGNETPWNNMPGGLPTSTVSSSLLPMVQQQLLTFQHQMQRRQHLQQMLSQPQHTAVAAALGINVGSGIETSQSLFTNRVANGSSLSGHNAIEDYLFAIQRGQATNSNNNNNQGAKNGDHHHRHLLSTLSSNYLMIPDALSSFHPPQSQPPALGEILQREATLAALRRHRLQMEEESLRGGSSIRPNIPMPNEDNRSVDQSSLAHLATLLQSSVDNLRETPAINNTRQLEEIISSLTSQPTRYDNETHALMSLQSNFKPTGQHPTEDANHPKAAEDTRQGKRATITEEAGSNRPAKKRSSGDRKNKPSR